MCVQPCTNIHFWFARAAESTRKPEREREGQRERERDTETDRDTDRDKNRETEGAKKHPKPKHVIATQ